MTVKALTTDGTWWSLGVDPEANVEQFDRAWEALKGRDLIKTKEDGLYIQKRNIVAIQLEGLRR